MKFFNAFLALSLVGSVAAFVPSVPRASTRLFETAEETSSETKTAEGLPMPLSYSEMVKQVAGAMRDASAGGVNRQIIRVCLPRDVNNQQLGTFSEGLLDVDGQNIILVPPDESWQGGIMQLYYSAAPTMSDALRLFTKDESGVPPRIEEDRTIDESGVDGCSLLTATMDGFAAKCFIQPSQETVDDFVEAEAKKNPKNLVCLLNPQWRVTDDWFDGVSRTDTGIFGSIAGFLGGKGNTLRKLAELGFEPTYSLEGYVCRGWNVRMVKRFDTDYTVYVDTSDAGSAYAMVGSAPERPTYQDVEKMLDAGGFQLRYAEGLI